MAPFPLAPSADPRGAGLDLLLDVLRCPLCARRLRRQGAALRCGQGHSFDIARDGHVSLLAGSSPISGDSAEMVGARRRFLESGRYGPIRDAVSAMAWEPAQRSGRRPGEPDAAPTVVDAGCGTGYYLAGVLAAPASLDAHPARGLGLDASARALRAAGRAGPRIAAVACDLFAPRLPVATGAADVVLNVFAPHNPAEFRRLLRPAGRLVVARPTDRHLAELRARVPGMVGVDADKEHRLRAALAPFFEVGEAMTRLVAQRVPVSPAEAVDLVGMTPSARHLGRESLAPELLPDSVTVSVLVTAFRPLS